MGLASALGRDIVERMVQLHSGARTEIVEEDVNLV